MGAIMRKRFLIFIVLLTILSTQAFILAEQPGGTTVTLLNRKNQATAQITDGDSIRVQITLSQEAATQEAIAFTLGSASLPAGSCIIPRGDTSCTTDAFA